MDLSFSDDFLKFRNIKVEGLDNENSNLFVDVIIQRHKSGVKKKSIHNKKKLYLSYLFN